MLHVQATTIQLDLLSYVPLYDQLKCNSLARRLQNLTVT
jgi:hypothetical protein